MVDTRTEYRREQVGTKTEKYRCQTGTERVVCGKQDDGNGYFKDVYCNEPVYGECERQVPVYDNVAHEVDVTEEQPVYKTKYNYTIYRFRHDHTLTERGQTSEHGKRLEPFWPRSDVDATARTSRQNRPLWRSSHGDQTYTVYFRDHEGAAVKRTFSQSKWEKFTPGKTMVVPLWYGIPYKGIPEP